MQCCLRFTLLLQYSDIDNGVTIIIILNQALKQWAEWGLAEKPTLLRVFKDGQNHHIGLIDAGGEKLVLKIFKHSFNKTIEVEYWTSELSLSPHLVMAANNTALYRFIEDQGYTPKRLKNLASTLKQTHNSVVNKGNDFDLIGYCDSYVMTANQEMQQWHAALMPILIEFSQDQTPKTYCHNDLVVENCLFTEHSALFIDWEFSQPNNPWFDLGAIVHYFKLDRSQSQEFLASYCAGWGKKAEQRIFYSSQISVLWCDLLWNMHITGNQYQSEHPDRFQQLIELALKLDIALST
jgi:thiamine kinase-like enzyme